jgi:hypothetical protein
MSNPLLVAQSIVFTVFIVVGMIILAASVKSLFTKKKVPC